MRQFALFSDVHGNLPALIAVLADIETAGIQERYCLGDLVGYGTQPSAVIAAIAASGVPTIMGNYDEGIGERRGECGCYYRSAEEREAGAASYEFTDGAVTDADREWMRALPREIRLEHAGRNVLLCHGSPRKINEYLLPDRTDRQLARLAREAGADLVCVGHIHLHYHRHFAEGGNTFDYVSCGSVGKPKDGDPRAGWALVTIADNGDVSVEARRVEFDR